MSLDVWLLGEGAKVIFPSVDRNIPIREDGQMVMLTRAEWNDRFPGREPVLSTSTITEGEEVFHANITHNLGGMAELAGIYKHVWRPNEIPVSKAGELIEPLTNGLVFLTDNAAQCQELNPPNGWGNYEVFVKFVRAYLVACQEHPNAIIKVWR